MAVDLTPLATVVLSLIGQVNKQLENCRYSGPDAQRLDDMASSLRALLNEIDGEVVSASIDAAQGAVTALNQATTDVNSAIAKINTVADVIKWAGLVLSLGAAVASGDPGKVISAGTAISEALAD